MIAQAQEIRGEAQRPASRRELAAQLENLYWGIAIPESWFQTVVQTFYNQLEIEPEDCTLFIAWLLPLRDASQRARDRFIELDQERAHYLSADANIKKLEEVDEYLTKILLYLTLFTSICNELLCERVEVHLILRTLLHKTNTILQDVLSQLTAQTERLLPIQGEEARYEK